MTLNQNVSIKVFCLVGKSLKVRDLKSITLNYFFYFSSTKGILREEENIQDKFIYSVVGKSVRSVPLGP